MHIAAILPLFRLRLCLITLNPRALLLAISGFLAIGPGAIGVITGTLVFGNYPRNLDYSGLQDIGAGPEMTMRG